MSHERALYLEKYWQSYPLVPEGSWTCGRLGFDFEISVIEGLNFLSSRQEMPKANQVLIKGDIIAFDSKNLVLLAPCLSAEGFKNKNRNEALAQKWSEFLQQVRIYFLNKNFEEMQTPTLTVCPGTEPFLDVFEVELQNGKKKEKRYLPTSPELSLKKLLVRGKKQIFEMRPCFRNNESGIHHQPEFWMLEWYRAYENLNAIEKDLKELILFLCLHFSLPAPATFSKKTIQELLQTHCGISLAANTNYLELKKICEDQKIAIHSSDLWDDLFYRIFVEKIEPQLPSQYPLIVHSYPPSQAAYARLNAEGWGERFEMYWKGLELCNAFHELNDPKIQKERFLEDLAKKGKTGRAVFPIDEEFLKDLESGMPPSSGIAVGLERLFMALFDVQDIRDLKLFPYGSEGF